MTKEALEKIMSLSFEDRKKLMIKKGNDYADERDVLSNFKRVGNIIDILFGSDEKVMIHGKFKYVVTMIILKLDRIINLLTKLEVSSESIIDSFDDLKNYIDLFEALKEE